MPKKTRKDSPDIKSKKNTTRRKLKIVETSNPRPLVDTIVNTLSSLNPFGAKTETETETETETVATAVQQNEQQITCEDKRCPVGYRCNEDKICDRLKNIELNSNEKRIVLQVDGNRQKPYDIAMLNRNFDRVFYLKTGNIDGKRITGIKLKTIIQELKTRIKGDTKSIYYGTLNDEMIIQIIHLEEIERSERTPIRNEQETRNTDIEPPKVGVNIDAVPEELPDNPFTEPVVEEPRFNKEIYQVPNLDISSTENERQLQDKIGILPDNMDSKEYNKYMVKKEKAEQQNLVFEDTYDFLYPELNDPNFNVKIAKRKEFNDTQYDGKIYDVKAQAEKMCNAEFELMPHQLFVKNFLSFQTPYNSLLLYHGLGTGKTCSAIGIAEEMRGYMKQVGGSQRIMVIASPNVQNNFRLQLFDEKKLSLIGGNWNLNTCIGNALLQEINPSQVQNLSRDKVVSQINHLISQYYLFMGYGELANYIKRKTTVDSTSGLTSKQQKRQEIGKLQALFNNRLVIIDEVHNIRVMQDNKEAKKTANLLMQACKYADNIRLLLLSATPVFNDHKEIIWLTNLLNAVDKRGLIDEKDVFTGDGEFTSARTLPDGTQLEGGEELLRRKLTGYVSYVRGENPYTFPYRIYPVDFAVGRQILPDSYPSIQMNNKPIDVKLSKTPIYIDIIGDYQKLAYEFIIKHLLQTSFNTTDVYGKEREMPTFENMESFGYTHLRGPLQSLNIVFPSASFDKISGNATPSGSSVDEIEESVQGESVQEESVPEIDLNESQSAKDFDESPVVGGSDENNSSNPDSSALPSEDADSTEDEDDTEESEEDDESIKPVDEETLQRNATIINSMLGKEGLSNIMTHTQTKTPFELRHNFKYKPEITEQYGSIFHPDNIRKYSGKIASICDSIKNSTGIVMVYSQFIDGGVVPVALALEEMGFTRYGFASHTKSLFETPPTEQVDSTTFKTLAETTDKMMFRPAKYVMITGEKSFSPNNLADLKYVTDPANKNGEQVRVVLITKAAAEGLDFKNIRQLHVLDPWYNINRIEQIIGRGVRNLSHCMLPFEERNVEIYLHATSPIEDTEPADLYVYRYAEKKAIDIGKITRILKEIAVDCILNIGQTAFTVDKLNAMAENQKIKLKLSSNQEIEYKIGDREGTGICDYMNCDFVCSPTATIGTTDIDKTTYGEHYIKMNYNAIAKRIRDIFREQAFYNRKQMLDSIQIIRKYPIEQIEYVLTMFVENKHNYLVDKYGRTGYLINAGDYYGFQPLDFNDERSSIYDKSVPVNFAPTEMYMELPVKKEGQIKPSTEVLTVVHSPLPNSGGIEKTYESLLQDLRKSMKTIDIEKEQNRKGTLLYTAESDWYKHMGHVYDELAEHVNIPPDLIQKYIVYHWIDMLTIEDKLVLVYHLYKVEPYTSTSPLEYIVKTYFDDKMFRIADEKCIALGGNNHIDMYNQVRETRQWNKATAATVRKYQEKLQARYHIEPANIQQFVGFMHIFKKNQMTFKMKEIVKQTTAKTVAKRKGFKCSVMGKNEIVKFLNTKVLDKTPYPVRQDKGGLLQYDVNKNAKNIMREGLCVMMEIIMRYFNDSPVPGNLKWFFDVEETLAIKLPSL